MATRIDEYLVSLGFTKSEVDSSLYCKLVNCEPLIVELYVDDLFLTEVKKLVAWSKEASL